jgi:hypothetical protein
MALLSRSTRQIITYAILAGLAPFMAGGCGSSSSKEEPGTDGGSDALAFTVHPDGSTSSGSSSSTGSSSTSSKLAYDGTTGAACQSDLDCQPANGPGLNTCSTSSAVFTGAVVYPTPVCIGKCMFTNNNMLQFCDGVATDTTDPPGVCIPSEALGPPNSTQPGYCLPWCQFEAGGTAPVGSNGSAPACQGNDVCSPFVFFPSFETDAGLLPPLGIGYCFGGCTADSQCPTGNACLTSEGICVPPAAVTTPSPLGTVCTSSASCDCNLNDDGGAGHCTQFCITGSSTAACPAGYVCDASEPAALPDPDSPGATEAAFTTQNPGLSGSCFPACTPAGTADAGTADSGTCPPNSTCTTGNAVGADCQP